MSRKKSTLTIEDHKKVAGILNEMACKLSALVNIVSGKSSRMRILDKAIKADRLLTDFRFEMENELLNFLPTVTNRATVYNFPKKEHYEAELSKPDF